MTEEEHSDQQATLAEFQEADASASLSDTVERNAEDIEQLRSILGDTIEQVNELAENVGTDDQPVDEPPETDGVGSPNPSMFQ